MIDCIATWQQAAGVLGFFFLAGLGWHCGHWVGGWLGLRVGQKG